MSNQTLVVLQARMSSSRLPGKVMMKINDKPMIYWQVKRILEASRVSDLVVATSVDATDDCLVNFLEENSVKVHRGSLENVLSRFTGVASRYHHDALIRLTGDCPLVMPELIDQMVDEFYELDVDYLSNTMEPTFPDGLDIEIVRGGILEELATFKLGDVELEHVTYGIYTRPETFSLSNFTSKSNFSAERWTVDYQEDLEFIRAIFKEFSGRELYFSYQEVLDYLSENPGLTSLINGYTRNEQLHEGENHG
jgi:spore coat polysaccharide biosynthesis protein SpsF